MKNKKNILIGVGVLVACCGIVAFDYAASTWTCRECGEVFKAPFKEYFFAGHTPTRRKLTCPNCGKKTYCKVQYTK